MLLLGGPLRSACCDTCPEERVTNIGMFTLPCTLYEKRETLVLTRRGGTRCVRARRNFAFSHESLFAYGALYPTRQPMFSENKTPKATARPIHIPTLATRIMHVDVRKINIESKTMLLLIGSESWGSRSKKRFYVEKYCTGRCYYPLYRRAAPRRDTHVPHNSST